MRILGPLTTEDRGGTVAFEVDGVHPHDVGQVLDELGIAMQDRPPLRVAAAPDPRLPGIHRASFYVYNTHDEVDALADGIRYAKSSSGHEHRNSV